MPRPKSGLKKYTFKLMPEDKDRLERLAKHFGWLTESGLPNHSAAAREIIRRAAAELDAKAAPRGASKPRPDARRRTLGEP